MRAALEGLKVANPVQSGQAPAALGEARLVAGSPKAAPRAVLFACGQNVIRSPMASALARHYFPAIYSVSAGVRRGEPDPFAIAVMEEIGIDIARHRPVTIEELEDTNFDLIVTLAPEAHHQALELTRSAAVEVEYWPTTDPSATTGSREQILDAYRELRELLTERILARFGWSPAAAG